MLTHVDLARYRGFQTYGVRGLSRVNLFVGMNNSGKTALLEGIQLLASGGDPSVLAQAAIRRGEVVVRRPEGPTLVEISHFFHGHQIELDRDFSITGNNGYTPVTVKVVALQDPHGKSEETAKVPRRVAQFAVKIDGGRKRTPEPRIYPLTREGVVQMEDPAPWRFEGYERLLINRLSNLQGSPTFFIGTDQVDSLSLAMMMDEVAMLGLEATLADAMRVLDPKLEYARMLSGASSIGFRGSRGGVIAKLQGIERPVPLGSLGEGMRRMLTLASALTTTRGGYLFIDEVDTGLHYSVMAKTWDLIITTATAYDIQVFASTHSYDCIYGLAKLFKKQPDLRDVFSIQRVEAEKKECVAFSAEEMVEAIRQDIEIR